MAVLSIQRTLLSITLALSLFSFAGGLVGVFVPLIMLQNGAALWQVPAFYMVYAVVKLFLNFPSVRITQRFGAHVGLGIAFVAGACEFGLMWLFTHTHNFGWIYAAGVSLAITNAALWNSMHIHISRVMSNATKSSSLATMEVINQMLGVLAPLIGGLIGYWLGASWLLVVAMFCVVLALLPLQQMGKVAQNVEAEKPVTYRLDHAPRRDVFANFCFNIEALVGSLVWPIFLAIEIKTYKSIGFITALAAAVTVVVVSIAGHRGDNGHDRRVLKEGVAASSLFDFMRLLPANALGITFISVGYKASLAYMQNSWTSTYYHHTKRVGIPYVMSMEIAGDLANVALWGMLLCIATATTSHAMFTVAFVTAGVAAWGCLLISKQGTIEPNL